MFARDEPALAAADVGRPARRRRGREDIRYREQDVSLGHTTLPILRGQRPELLLDQYSPLLLAVELLCQPPLPVARDGVEHERERHLALELELLAVVIPAFQQLAHVTHLDLLELAILGQTREVGDPRFPDGPTARAFYDRRGVNLHDGELVLGLFGRLARRHDDLEELGRVRAKCLRPARRLFPSEVTQQRLQAAGADGPVHEPERQPLTVKVAGESKEAATLAGLEQTRDFHGLLLGRRQATASYRARGFKDSLVFAELPLGIALVLERVEPANRVLVFPLALFLALLAFAPSSFAPLALVQRRFLLTLAVAPVLALAFPLAFGPALFALFFSSHVTRQGFDVEPRERFVVVQLLGFAFARVGLECLSDTLFEPLVGIEARLARR